jgi:hypothetical protein
MHELVKLARGFAEQKHAGQKYGNLPVDMIVHLDAVHAILLEFGETDEVILAAAYLHDTLEDTETYPEEIKRLFGEDVLNFVQAVTDGKGKNRAERKAGVYKKLRGSWRFVRLKLADRIANTKYSKAEKSPQLSMYAKEYPEFKLQLYTGVSDSNKDMWDYLDTLMHSVVPATFKLLRTQDVSGVSGIGVVAEGVIFTNGKCAVTWYGKIASVTVYNTFKDCEQIHGHEGRTKFIFDNEV